MKRQQHPDDGAVSAIVHGKRDGDPLTRQRDVRFHVFFVHCRPRHRVRDAQQRLPLAREQPRASREIIDNPENINAVVEELLRVFSVTFSGRTLTQDYEMRGVRMKKGDKVTCILPTANYDPEVFENPREVNFHRPRKPILAFAGGVHSCMGAHLARLEMKVSIAQFLKRIPDFELKAGTKIEYWPGGVVGPKVLPLMW